MIYYDWYFVKICYILTLFNTVINKWSVLFHILCWLFLLNPTSCTPLYAHSRTYINQFQALYDHHEGWWWGIRTLLVEQELESQVWFNQKAESILTLKEEKITGWQNNSYINTPVKLCSFRRESKNCKEKEEAESWRRPFEVDDWEKEEEEGEN